jgi:hypothetical protein
MDFGLYKVLELYLCILIFVINFYLTNINLKIHLKANSF